MNQNPALLPLAERERYTRLHELAQAITQYKRRRTAYANRASGENRIRLSRAEHTLVAATRWAVTAVDLVTRRQQKGGAK